ncbi:MAG: DUF4198 domain-containing protein [Cocleimonas sp.]
MWTKKGTDCNVFYTGFKKIYLMLIYLLFLMGFSSITVAHEMWIEPVSYKVNVGDNIYAHEKVGQNFKGNEYAYLNTSYKKLNITVGDITRVVKSRLGDIPAIKEKADEEGLYILTAITTGSNIKYKSWAKFESFIKSKGLDWVLERHKEKGLPEKDFSEFFQRFPKSLVKVGHGKGVDREFSLPIEWIAESNPYTTDTDIQLRLMWHGKPYVDAHVDVFNRVKNSDVTFDVLKSTLFTDSQGRVTIPRSKGGEFLINAVQILEYSASTKESEGVVWETYWASLTYELD